MQAMRFFARCQFFPAHHLQAFVIGFIRLGLQIFSPYTCNPTFFYVAYKDGEEGDQIHLAIIRHEEK